MYLNNALGEIISANLFQEYFDRKKMGSTARLCGYLFNVGVNGVRPG